jgi:hypothetical protein
MSKAQKKGSRVIPMNKPMLLMIQTTLSMVRASLCWIAICVLGCPLAVPLPYFQQRDNRQAKIAWLI